MCRIWMWLSRSAGRCEGILGENRDGLRGKRDCLGMEVRRREKSKWYLSGLLELDLDSLLILTLRIAGDSYTKRRRKHVHNIRVLEQRLVPNMASSCGLYIGNW